MPTSFNDTKVNNCFVYTRRVNSHPPVILFSDKWANSREPTVLGLGSEYKRNPERAKNTIYVACTKFCYALEPG